MLILFVTMLGTAVLSQHLDARCRDVVGGLVRLLPHDYDCTKFYKCVGDFAMEQDCPPGLHFNPRLEVCDWPWQAGCQAV